MSNGDSHVWNGRPHPARSTARFLGSQQYNPREPVANSARGRIGNPRDGWQPIGICVTPDGQRWFLLKRQKELAHPGDWQYKTVIGRTDDVLDNPTNQGWNVIGYAMTADNEKWYLLKKPKT